MQAQLITEIESIAYKHEVVFPTQKWQLYFVNLNILKLNRLWKKKLGKSSLLGGKLTHYYSDREETLHRCKIVSF